MRTMQELTRRIARKDGYTARRLDPKAVGLTSGVLWGLGLFSLTWWIIALDGSSREPTAISRVYRGYRISPRGSVIGLAWAFVDGLIGGACFAWLYNQFVKFRRSA
jgi:hypothetical protein